MKEIDAVLGKLTGLERGFPLAKAVRAEQRSCETTRGGARAIATSLVRAAVAVPRESTLGSTTFAADALMTVESHRETPASAHGVTLFR